MKHTSNEEERGTVATAEEVIRNYELADRAYRDRLAKEVEKLGDIAADDVRTAKAHLSVPTDLRDRLLDARIALQTMNAANNERWISAHEDLAVLRRSGVIN